MSSAFNPAPHRARPREFGIYGASLGFVGTVTGPEQIVVGFTNTIAMAANDSGDIKLTGFGGPATVQLITPTYHPPPTGFN